MLLRYQFRCALIPTRNRKRGSICLPTSWFVLDSSVLCPDCLPWTIQLVPSSCNPAGRPFSFHSPKQHPADRIFPTSTPPDSFTPPIATTAVAHNATVTELGFSPVPPQWSVASIRFKANWTRAYSKLITIKPERRLSSCC